MQLKQLLPQTATLAEFECYQTFNNLIRAEEFPDDPPRSLEYTIAFLRGRAALKEVECQTWFIQENKRMLARACYVLLS